MPGHAGEIARLADADFGQRLGGGDHLHEAAIFQHQRVAVAQHHGFGQIEQELQPAHAGHGDAAAVALLEIEHDGIGGLGLPGASGADEIGADHGVVLKRACRSLRG